MSVTERRLLISSQLRLIEAVRNTAEQDGPEALEEFDQYWIRSPKWSRVWSELREMMVRDRTHSTRGGS